MALPPPFSPAEAPLCFGCPLGHGSFGSFGILYNIRLADKIYHTPHRMPAGVHGVGVSGLSEAKHIKMAASKYSVLHCHKLAEGVVCKGSWMKMKSGHVQIRKA